MVWSQQRARMRGACGAGRCPVQGHGGRCRYAQEMRENWPARSTEKTVWRRRLKTGG